LEELVYLTLEEKRKLEEKLAELERKSRRISQDIAQALSDKDVAENSPLEAAREEQALNEAWMREIRQKLENCVIVEQAEEGVVGIGSTVTIQDQNSMDEFEYTIVGDQEFMDISRGHITSNSPIGSGLLGKREGEIVTIEIPIGKVRYKILKVNHRG